MSNTPSGPAVPFDITRLYRPGLVTPVAIPTAPGAGAEVSGNSRYLMGWSVANTSTSALAAFQIINGRDNTGLVVHPVNLFDNESSREWFGPDGIWFSVGIFVVVTLGAVLGTLFVADAVIREAAGGADF